VSEFVADDLPGALKSFTAGTHRAVSPEQTLGRVQPWLKAMGITRIANITGLDALGVPVVMVCRPNSRSLSVAQGKGATLAAAKASGLMESVEFWHAERISKPLVLGSVLDLKFTQRLVDVARMPRLSVSTFDEHQRILWIEGLDLISSAAVWVPYECVHTDYRLPLPPGSGCFAMSSNGLASGNHPLEAVAHAICEVIERDATALWHAGGTEGRRTRRLRLDSVTDPLCRRLLDDYARADVLAAVWNTTTDIGVPCFACEIVDGEAHTARAVGPSAGMGCHTSPAVALARALTEAAQSRLTRIASSRDDVPRIDYEVFRSPDVLSAVRAEYLDTPATVEYESITGFESNTFEEDVRWLIGALTAVGIEEIVAVDLTHAHLRIPVVRVIVPGLEPPHEAPGYMPGARARASRANSVAP
jgi:YcaO-like protein with predicted kinase domain